MRRLWVWAIFTILSAGPGYAAEPDATAQWRSAMDLAQSGRTEEALNVLKAHPAEDPTYYYDLGTLLLRLDRPGPAVAYLEKAGAENPSDPAIKKNLEIARNALSRLIGREQIDPASNALEKTAELVGNQELLALLSVASLVAVALGLRAYLRTRRTTRGWSSFSSDPLAWAGVLGLGLALLAAFSVERIHERPAAILSEADSIRSGPGENFLELAHLEAGTKLRPTGESAQATDSAKSRWDQVRFAPDAVGWVAENKLVFLK